MNKFLAAVSILLGSASGVASQTAVQIGRPASTPASVCVYDATAARPCTPMGSRLGPSRNVTSGAVDSLSVSDYTVNWSSAAASAKVEAIPACGAGNAGQVYTIADTALSAGSYNIALTPASGTIGGQSSQSIQFSGATQTIKCDGISNWVME